MSCREYIEKGRERVDMREKGGEGGGVQKTGTKKRKEGKDGGKEKGERGTEKGKRNGVKGGTEKPYLEGL